MFVSYKLYFVFNACSLHIIFVGSSTSASFSICNNTNNTKNCETRSLTTPNKFVALSTETQPLVPLPESVPTTSNSEHSNTPEIPQPRKSAPKEYATDEEDKITYDVEEEELEPDPTFKFALKESPSSYRKGYLRALTPRCFRKGRS
ncbi:hypothetical protein TNCV_2392801 [Trichonephila clavipes]|nr:hypothetical protein TNCV_2392801 [Trichonephila clavipes]